MWLWLTLYVVMLQIQKRFDMLPNTFTSTICSFPDLKQKSALIKGKQLEISDMISEINQKETQKDNILAKIQKLREEQAKRQEGTFIFGTISSIGLLHLILS